MINEDITEKKCRRSADYFVKGDVLITT
jgi:hypothetical protein